MKLGQELLISRSQIDPTMVIAVPDGFEVLSEFDVKNDCFRVIARVNSTKLIGWQK